MNKPEFVYQIFIAREPDKVWEALTGPDFTYQFWGHRRLLSDWQIGSTVRSQREDGGLDFEGKVLTYDRPKVLSYTFSTPQGSTTPTRVTFDLQPYGPNTILTLTHDQFAEGAEISKNTTQGWAGILSGLKTLLETGQPMIAPGWNA